MELRFFGGLTVEETAEVLNLSLASSARIDLDPAFSPDGRQLAFVSEPAARGSG